MAHVYEGWDTDLPVRRAIVKIVRARAGRRLSAKEREGLLHEARKTAHAAEMNQDYFALVYELGYDSEADLAWFAMQKLSGQTFRELLEARKQVVPARPGLDIETACGLTMEVLKALGILHAIGMFHSDVKPANVMWTTDGKVKLLDLGLAQFLRLFEEDGVVAGGTPAYLAPEVYGTKWQDHRVDLFAAGVMLHELLTGRLPAALLWTREQARRAHEDGCIPNAARKAEIPPFCREVIAKAADPDPGRRYRTAEDFREALEAGLTAWRGPGRDAPEPDGSVTAGGGRRRRLAVLALGLGAIVLLGSLAYALRPPARENTPPQTPPGSIHISDFHPSDVPRSDVFRVPSQAQGTKPPPAAPVPYRVECNVRVTRRGVAKLDKGPALGGATIDSLRPDDRVYIEAQLLDAQTAYFYVLQIDSRGQAKALYPEGWARDRLPKSESPRAEVRIPEEGAMPMDPEASPGVEALICLVRPEPLTPEHNALLWDLFAGKEWAWEQPRASEKKVFVSFVDGTRTTVRSFNPKGARVDQDPVGQTERFLLRLKNRGVAAGSHAICYSFVVPRAAGAKPGKDRP
jgi:serine/threonine protein kinase